MVNAKRMGVEIGRRFSATMDPASTSATAPANAAGSAAPAAAAPAAAGSTRKVTQRQNAVDGSGSASEQNAMTPLLGSRNPFEKTVGGAGSAGKVEAAADLLARVRGQLESSEQRTKGLPVERQEAGDIAPPR